MSSPARIVIVDDHPIVRQGLAAVLDRHPGLKVVGEAADCQSGYEVVRRLQPDVLVLDISMPGASGLDLLARLATTHPSVAVLVVSMLHEDDYAERAFSAGARGYVMKEEASERIVEATLAVLAGRIFVRGGSVRREARVGRGVEGLANVEIEVLRLLGQGHSTRSIAQIIHKSPKSVELYRSRLRAHLGLETSNELILYAGKWLAEQTARGPT